MGILKTQLMQIADELESAAWGAEFNSRWLSDKADEIRSIAELVED